MLRLVECCGHSWDEPCLDASYDALFSIRINLEDEIKDKELEGFVNFAEKLFSSEIGACRLSPKKSTYSLYALHYLVKADDKIRSLKGNSFNILNQDEYEKIIKYITRCAKSDGEFLGFRENLISEKPLLSTTHSALKIFEIIDKNKYVKENVAKIFGFIKSKGVEEKNMLGFYDIEERPRLGVTTLGIESLLSLGKLGHIEKEVNEYLEGNVEKLINFVLKCKKKKSGFKMNPYAKKVTSYHTASALESFDLLKNHELLEEEDWKKMDEDYMITKDSKKFLEKCYKNGGWSLGPGLKQTLYFSKKALKALNYEIPRLSGEREEIYSLYKKEIPEFLEKMKVDEGIYRGLYNKLTVLS